MNKYWQSFIISTYLEPIPPGKLCCSQGGYVDCSDGALQADRLVLLEKPQLLGVIADGPVGMKDLVDSLKLFVTATVDIKL